jgi:hypothetical protein
MRAGSGKEATHSLPGRSQIRIGSEGSDACPPASTHPSHQHVYEPHPVALIFHYHAVLGLGEADERRMRYSLGQAREQCADRNEPSHRTLSVTREQGATSSFCKMTH